MGLGVRKERTEKVRFRTLVLVNVRMSLRNTGGRHEAPRSPQLVYSHCCLQCCTIIDSISCDRSDDNIPKLTQLMSMPNVDQKDLWVERRDLFERLYLEENLTLGQVKERVENAPYSFPRHRLVSKAPRPGLKLIRP